MKSKVRLEKYINFSLISNCIIFNTLAGCGKGKDKKGGGGCSGSGKDKDPVIIGEGKNEQSAEKLAKKKKEAEEKEKKEQEDKEKQDLLQKITNYKEKYNNLKVKVDELNNEDPSNPININSFITLDEINNLEIKNINAIDERFSNLEKEITKKQKEIDNKLESEKKNLKDEFNSINNDVTIINSQNVYNIIVPIDIIKIDEIINCKLSQVSNLKAKLTNFKNTKDKKITEIKDKLNGDLLKVNDTEEKKTNLSKFKDIKIITKNDIDNCKIEDFSSMKTNIVFLQNLANGDIDAIKKFFKDEIEKYKDSVDIFKKLDESIESTYNDLISSLALVISIDSVSDFYNSISDFQKKINNSINEYNKKNTNFINDIKVKVAELYYEYNSLKFDYKFEVLELNNLNINSKKGDYDNIETNKKNIKTTLNTKIETINNKLKKLILLIYDTYKVLYKEDECNKNIEDISKIDVKDYKNLKTFKEKITNLDAEYKKLISDKITEYKDNSLDSDKMNKIKKYIEDFKIKDVDVNNFTFNNIYITTDYTLDTLKNINDNNKINVVKNGINLLVDKANKLSVVKDVIKKISDNLKTIYSNISKIYNNFFLKFEYFKDFDLIKKEEEMSQKSNKINYYIHFVNVKKIINFEYKEEDFNIDNFDNLITIIEKYEQNLKEIKPYLEKCIDNLSKLLKYCEKNEIKEDETKGIKELENILKPWEESNFTKIDETYSGTLFKENYVNEYNKIFGNILAELFNKLGKFYHGKDDSIDFDKIYVYTKYNKYDAKDFDKKEDFIFFKDNLFLFNLSYPFVKIVSKLLYLNEEQENNLKTDFSKKVAEKLKGKSDLYNIYNNNDNVRYFFYSHNYSREKYEHLLISENYYKFLRERLGDLLED